MMLKRLNRLTQKFQFKVAKKYGKKVFSDCFNMYFVKPTNYTGPTKFGFIVSNQVTKLATKRNYAKRKLREAVRSFLKDGPIKQDLWIVFFVNNKILTKSYAEICISVNKALQEVSLAS